MLRECTVYIRILLVWSGWYYSKDTRICSSCAVAALLNKLLTNKPRKVGGLLSTLLVRDTRKVIY